jgi:group II intron reverse transcriptase/maturase
MSNQDQTVKKYLEEMSKKKRKDMSSFERVQLLQRKLYLKAKESKNYKFYVLYDKVFLGYILEQSWLRVKRNGGSAGVDGESFATIENAGVDNFLLELQEDLRKRTYRPQAVKRVEIPKGKGETRPLGIPTIRDRVAQMACKLVIEPIFEADFKDESYGFRPKRSAKDAVVQIKEELKSGKQEVYDADLSKYFDTIPHEKLILALKERIADSRIIDLINKWLKTPIFKDGQIQGGKKVKVGTPQGGVISPLLSNIYLNLFDRIVTNPNSIFARTGIKLIRYADDFVLIGKRVDGEVIGILNKLFDRMGLRLNLDKSHLVKAKDESFDFLGFTFRYDQCLYDSNRQYLNIIPSKKSCKKLRSQLKLRLTQIGHFPPGEVASSLNAILRGWLNYFDIPSVSYLQITRIDLRQYLNERLYRYYNRKSQRRSRLHRQQAYQKLISHHGLINIMTYRTT